jgi:hypothetical protein
MNKLHYSPILRIGLMVLVGIGSVLVFNFRTPAANAALVFRTPARIPGASIGVKYLYSFCQPRPATGHVCGQILSNPPDIMPNSGKPPYVFRINGVGVPFGLSLSLNGFLTGTPNNKNRPGVYRFQVCVTDGFNIRRCGNTSIVIAAQPFTVTATKKGTGGGNITYSPKLYQLVCNPKCHPAFVARTRVVITAHPDKNSTFSGWGGDCKGKGTCRLTMNGNKKVTYTFTKKASTNTNTNTNTNTTPTTAHHDATLALAIDDTLDYTETTYHDDGSVTKRVLHTFNGHVDTTMTLTDDGAVKGVYSYRCTDPGGLAGYESGSIVGGSYTSSGRLMQLTDGLHISISADSSLQYPTPDWSQMCGGPAFFNMINYAVDDIFSTLYGNSGRLTSWSTSIVNSEGEVVNVGRTFTIESSHTITYSGTLTVDKL